MCCANLGERGITQQRAARSAKRGVGHYWHCVLRTPGQQVMFNGAVTKTVGNLICCAAIAMPDIEKPVHVADVEIGDAPGGESFPLNAGSQKPPRRPTGR